MNDSFQPDQWDYSDSFNTPGNSNRFAKKAAIFLWITAGLEFLMGSCISCGFGALASMPFDQFVEQSQGQYTLEQLEMLEIAKQYAPVLTLAAVILTVVPAIILLVLAFFVWRAKKVATWTAAVILLSQSIIYGLFVVLTIVGALSLGNLFALFSAAIIYGTPLALLIYTTILLFKSAMQIATPSNNIEDYWD